jgi:hypothetical protein
MHAVFIRWKIVGQAHCLQAESLAGKAPALQLLGGESSYANELKADRGGGTDGECSSAKEKKSTSSYWKGTARGKILTTRAIEMMSIFGVGDCASCFCSEDFPLFTM